MSWNLGYIKYVIQVKVSLSLSFSLFLEIWESAPCNNSQLGRPCLPLGSSQDPTPAGKEFAVEPLPSSAAVDLVLHSVCRLEPAHSSPPSPEPPGSLGQPNSLQHVTCAHTAARCIHSLTESSKAPEGRTEGTALIQLARGPVATEQSAFQCGEVGREVAPQCWATPKPLSTLMLLGNRSPLFCPFIFIYKIHSHEAPTKCRSPC